jgi:hypothetical protein
MRKLLGLMPVAALILGFSSVANAAEVTRVASSAEEDDPFDLHFGVSYQFDFKKAAILRESSFGSNDNRLAKDLIYRQMRHTVTPQLEIGIFRDLSVYLEMPIIVGDKRDYSFDQEADDCAYPGDAGVAPGDATCVNKTNSSSVRDGIVPANGWDGLSPEAPYNAYDGPNTELIFQGPKRQGLDQLHVGLKYKVLNQEKLSHMPNWVIGLEGRFSIGKPMQLSRDTIKGEPETNTSVGRGMHELGVWTSLSRRYRYLDPFFGAYWRQAMTANKTMFEDLGGTQDKVTPQSTTGAFFGAEIVPWERRAKSQRFSIILAGTAELKYNGRGYSEVWELLADSPALAGVERPGDQSCDVDAGVAHSQDPDNLNDPSGYLAAGGANCKAFNGITRIQDYGTFGMNAALNFHLGPFARLNFGARLKTDTRHFLTASSRGDADAVTGAGTDPEIVDQGTAEVNPVRRDVVDTVGRRYAIDDVFMIVPYLNFIVTF